jgi:hypothetical protein
LNKSLRQPTLRFGTPFDGLLILALALFAGGCASMATERLAANLSNAMLNQKDPEIVRSGAPAYLLLLDSLIEEDPRDQGLLYAGARLYGAYAGGLVEDPARKETLLDKAFAYVKRGFCPEASRLCAAAGQPFDRFAAALAETDADEIEGVYLYATHWAGWIQAHSEDWSAIAELPKARAMLEWVVALDPAYEGGRAQLYLGVIDSQVPPALGGNPEIGRRHFETAIRYSQGRDLIAKVEFARHYARLVFDQPLHDRLLQEVLQADPDQPGLTLSNVMAQRQAARLLQENYF